MLHEDRRAAGSGARPAGVALERMNWLEAVRRMCGARPERSASSDRCALGPARRIAVRVLDPGARPRPVRFVRVFRAQ